MGSRAGGHPVPDDPIAYWEGLGFDVIWGGSNFGEPISLYVRLKELDIFFVGEGRDANETYEDAWRYYVAHHIDAVERWCDAENQRSKDRAFASQDKYLIQQEREQVRSGWTYRRR